MNKRSKAPLNNRKDCKIIQKTGKQKRIILVSFGHCREKSRIVFVSDGVIFSRMMEASDFLLFEQSKTNLHNIPLLMCLMLLFEVFIFRKRIFFLLRH